MFQKYPTIYQRLGLAKKVRAFSLLEIMVAVSLLAVSLVAIISVATKITQVENVTENDFVAKGLLIEGLELAEDVRNNNVANAQAFYTGLTSGTPIDGQTYTMRIDYTGNNNTAVDDLADNNARLLYDASQFYQYTTGAATKFYRILQTTYHTDGTRDWLEVESQLYWADRGKGATQRLSTVLYNTAY